MRLRLRRSSAAAVAAALIASARAARAGDPNEGGAAAAEQLFQEGRKAMDARHYADACPKFLASQKIAPAIGTLLNLADCYEKVGQLASAWARFHEAIALAQRLGRPDRERTARERADKLEPRLVKLTILAKYTGVSVSLDGNAIDPAVLGTPLPVDPGKHTIAASAKGKKTFTTTLDVSERTRTPSVEIPALDDDATPGGNAGSEGTGAGDGSSQPRPPDGETGGTQRILGLAAAGAGIVGVGVGVGFGLRTSSKWNDAKTHCSGFDCDAQGVDLAGQAKTSGNVSTAAFVIGGVLAAGGAVLYLTAPSGARVGVGVGPRAVVVGGTFR